MTKRIGLLLIVVLIAVGIFTSTGRVSGQSDGDAAPIYGVKIPPGYRDWTMISGALVGAPVSDLRIKLGNDVAIKAYREGTRPFPDGTIIARLAYQQITSDENNKVFRAAAEQRGLPAEQIDKLLAASFVAGPATNVQFMVKDNGGLCTKSAKLIRFLCGPLCISAFSALKLPINAEIAEIRRGPQRRPAFSRPLFVQSYNGAQVQGGEM